MAEFRRKIYQMLQEWKAAGGKSALLIEGARCIGKSKIVEFFVLYHQVQCDGLT